MPIKGLTDGGDRFPIIGDIRKGAPKTEEKKPGKDLTYFRYVPIEGEEEAAAAFFRVYGDEPCEINVFLPFDEVDRNFDAWMERHTAGALQCRGDGEKVTLWRDGNGEIRHESKECPGDCEGCKATGYLRVIIPELRRLASVVIHTTSKWDIQELSGNLAALVRTEGRLTGIPLILKRRPRQVSTPRANGKRVRQTKWLLSIEAAPRYVDERLSAMEAEALPNGNGNNAPALPEPEELESEYVKDDTDAVIEAAEEFGGEIIEEETPFVINTLGEFEAACKARGISGKEINAALRSDASTWCYDNNKDLTECFAYICEVCGK